MAWHRQIQNQIQIARQTSSTALISPDSPAVSSPVSSPGHSLPRGGDGGENGPLECSQDSSEQERFEMCPHAWYRQAKEEGGARGTWRLMFLCLCLPLCYPCYLTRSARVYRRKKRPKYNHNHSTYGARSTSVREVGLSPDGSQSPPVKFRVDAMFLQGPSSFKFLNQVKLEKVTTGQNVIGKTRVILSTEYIADVHVAFESSCCDTSVSDFPVTTASSLVSEIDVLVIAYREETELLDTLSRTTGILGYCSQYWRGYYPVLIVRLSNTPETDPMKRETVELIHNSFSWCQIIQLSETYSEQDQDLLMTILFQVYLHVFRFRCDLGDRTKCQIMTPWQRWRCPGQCGLTSQQLIQPRWNLDRRKMARNMARKFLGGRTELSSNIPTGVTRPSS